MNISEKILELRKTSNMTQEDLAVKRNISRQSISKWESGQSMPDMENILLMSEIFHVTTDHLLKPSDPDSLTQKTNISLIVFLFLIATARLFSSASAEEKNKFTFV